jgi:hypothetical protein
VAENDLEIDRRKTGAMNKILLAFRGFIIGSSLPAIIWPLAGLAYKITHPRATPSPGPPRPVPTHGLISPPASGSVPGADRCPLPSSPSHTPQWSDLPARSETKRPVRPHSQDELSHVGQRSPEIDPFTSSWYSPVQAKRPFIIPIPIPKSTDDIVSESRIAKLIQSWSNLIRLKAGR